MPLRLFMHTEKARSYHPEDPMVLLVLSAWSECSKILKHIGDIDRLAKLLYREPISYRQGIPAMPVASVVRRFDRTSKFLHSERGCLIRASDERKAVTQKDHPLAGPGRWS